MKKRITLKRHLFTTLFVFTFALCSLSQNGIIEYRQQMINSNVVDGEKMEGKMLSSIKQKLEELKFYSSRVSYTLKFKNKLSCFRADPIMDMDDGTKIQSVILAASGNGIWFVNIEQETSEWFKELYGRMFVIEDDIKLYDWRLSNEQKQIGDYRCLKAETKKTLDNGSVINVVAWYAPEIPIGFGPKEYCGLPGLILEVRENRFSFIAKKVILGDVDIEMPELPKNAKKVSKDQYHEIVKKGVKDRF